MTEDENQKYIMQKFDNFDKIYIDQEKKIQRLEAEKVILANMVFQIQEQVKAIETDYFNHKLEVEKVLKSITELNKILVEKI